ncbi:hypothetical protein [Streptomyces sp. NBC_00154]|uniref:hypothetical protein n=1 Tax=Streptomyces sp. NBC_00154 TaxID=2975670 RepID=UPI00224EA8EB|nr:hypothetical protein [Streptomyces sp. NBC_00154]MCX5317242.1 hypothetical protein [Streptomyces sp. NBC_00154]
MAKPSDELIELARASLAAQEKALSEPYTEERWAPWRRAAEAFQAAVIAEAEATEQGRYALEMAAKRAVLHPEPSIEG